MQDTRPLPGWRQVCAAGCAVIGSRFYGKYLGFGDAAEERCARKWDVCSQIDNCLYPQMLQRLKFVLNHDLPEDKEITAASAQLDGMGEKEGMNPVNSRQGNAEIILGGSEKPVTGRHKTPQCCWLSCRT
jgi:hypothetical protein